MTEVNLDVGTRAALGSLRDWLFVQGNAATFSFSLLNGQATSVIHGESAPSANAPGSVPAPAVASWTGTSADGGRLSFRLNVDTGEIELDPTCSSVSLPFPSTVKLVRDVTSSAPGWLFDIRGRDKGGPLHRLNIIQVSLPAKQTTTDNNRWFVPSWVAEVRNRADQLEADLMRVALRNPLMPYEADYQTVRREIESARLFAARPVLTKDDTGPRRHFRPQRIADWWTGYCVDRAWTALHTASQALLMIQDEEEVKSELADMKANVAHELTKGDSRINSFLNTLNLLSASGRDISEGDRKNLRRIRAVCDSSGEAGHVDARSFRNNLILIGAFLSVVLTAVAVVGAADKSFSELFAVSSAPSPSRWIVLEIELVASLSGLTAAVLSLQSYTGFRWTYGLQFVQAVVKGATGAATGLFGVFLVLSGLVTSLKITDKIEIFAVAIIFGYAQYLFTRLIDQKANEVLKSASSRNDPSAAPQVPAGSGELSLATASAPSRPQVTGISPSQDLPGKQVRLTGSGFKGATEVTFGETVATDVTIDSDACITAISPPGEGTVDITVTTPGCVSAKSASAKFRYLNGN
jgi:hypothetical protein